MYVWRCACKWEGRGEGGWEREECQTYICASGIEGCWWGGDQTIDRTGPGIISAALFQYQDSLSIYRNFHNSQIWLVFSGVRILILKYLPRSYFSIMQSYQYRKYMYHYGDKANICTDRYLDTWQYLEYIPITVRCQDIYLYKYDTDSIGQ